MKMAMPRPRVLDDLRVSAVVSACRLVDKRFPAPVTLTELSRHCGVAQRTLEYGFRQVYDTTPLAFIRSQRLTRNRMALLGARASTSISDTARACGFTHMGQYCKDYRRLFGETPSMTLARGRMIQRARCPVERDSLIAASRSEQVSGNIRRSWRVHHREQDRRIQYRLRVASERNRNAGDETAAAGSLRNDPGGTRHGWLDALWRVDLSAQRGTSTTSCFPRYSSGLSQDGRGAPRPGQPRSRPTSGC